ncbi:hypothetical protein [Falsiroseomonas oryziterrae]|uniref:hypothetical protein n=1 Tax=Falsiroseomonas oryziterrae TaxID=2911368 RepID=UPI001F4093B2|nr:hypothetical protein [Roseomonas sp. NPKOSM-4]
MIGAGVLWFAVMFGLGFLLGPVRILVLEPRLGPTGAVLVEAVPMVAAMTLLAPWVARLFDVAPTAAARLGMGAVGLILLLMADTLLGWLLFGRGVGSLLERPATWDGRVYLAMLLLFVLMPWLRRRA